MNEKEREQLLTEYFSRYISDHKKNLIEKALDNRTQHIAVVLENIFQSQNASAVIRTCECMGLQQVHIIENDLKYSLNKRVLKGAEKWIDLIRYNQKKINNTETCFQSLRSAGYTIYATDPSPDGKSIHEIEIKDKVAIVMGNELHGISDYALQHADGKVHIPMYGFTESLNISVSAAICLNTLIPQLRQSSVNWQLTEEEKSYIRLKWYRKCVRKSELLEREYLRSIG